MGLPRYPGLLVPAAMVFGGMSALAQNTLQGVVLNSVTHRPIARVLVESPTGGPSVLTDNTGHFSFADVPSGVSELRYRRPGYFALSSEATTASWPITVEADAPEQTVFLEPAAGINGQLTLSDGEDPAGILVQLLREQVIAGHRIWQLRDTARVEADGSFEFGDLPPGAYLLHAPPSLDPVPPGSPPAVRSGYTPAYAPEAKDLVSANVFVVEPGQTQPARIRLTRAPFYPVKVRVATDVAGGSFLVNGEGFVDWSAHFPGNDGEVTAELPSGNYTLTGRTYGRDTDEGQALLHVEGAPLSGPSLTFAPASTIHIEGAAEGDAGGSPATPLTLPVMLIPASADGSAAHDTATLFVKEGSTEDSRPGLPSGTYWVAPVGAGSGYIAEMTSGGVDLLAEPLTLSAGTNPKITAVIRRDAGAITITREGDALAQPCSVQAVPLSRAGVAQTLRAPPGKGTLVIANLPPGDYIVLATTASEPIAFREPGVLQALRGTRVTVRPGGSARATLSALLASAGLF